MSPRFPVIALLLTLAACGNQDSAQKKPAPEADPQTAAPTAPAPDTSIDVKSGDSAAKVQLGGDVSGQLPAFAPAYPGGKVTQSLAAESGEGTGLMVMFETADSDEAVLAFYRKAATAAGMVVENEVKVNDTALLGAKMPQESDKRGFQIMATPGGNGKTNVQLMVALK